MNVEKLWNKAAEEQKLIHNMTNSGHLKWQLIIIENRTSIKAKISLLRKIGNIISIFGVTINSPTG